MKAELHERRLKAIDWKGFSEKQIKAIKYTQKRLPT
ncbi:hypothetical protein FOZG_10506 [Fusarium oxysporum Fo47]|uniref:Uncharacterized protein n=1 Tax=Fusarium oxysporum Fo47 TaxID=660027 RepID=W9JWQ8_FUSOX|nr:hypothetical protein FOZG_10506 [Fusarium oxysporum Fo47]